MPSSGPWNDWYHVTVSTYGAWLPGDPRGWRSRHHREHVDGDYQYPPPPGKYDTLHRAATKSMKRQPIVLPAEIRATVMKTLRDALQHYGVTIAVIAVAANTRMYWRNLGRTSRPREWLDFVMRISAMTGWTPGRATWSANR